MNGSKNPEKKIKKSDFVWERIGRCQPKKCASFCCRVGPVIHLLSGTKKQQKDDRKYYELQNMQEVGKIKGKALLARRVSCAALKGLRCRIHKKRPTICKSFPPHPSSQYYQMCKQHGCTYRFVKVKRKKK
jgi:Fe-S-cluster containining protein